MSETILNNEMMNTLRTMLKGFLVLCFGLFVVLIAWANWEEPPLSARLNLKPINLVVFKLSQPIAASDSTTLSQNLSQTTGVTACAVNPDGQAVSITYHNDQVSETRLRVLVNKVDVGAAKINFAAYDGPKCPVPAEYINFLTDLKTNLCFR